MVSNYKEFITESIIYNLIAEAKIEYMNKFKDILLQMKSEVAKELLDIIGKDVDITLNYIDITDKDDTLSFYPSKTKFKYKITDRGHTYPSFEKLFTASGLTHKDVHTLPNGTIGKIVKIFDEEELKSISGTEYRNTKIAHFISDDGQHSFIATEGLEKLPSTRKQESRVGRIAIKLLQSVNKKLTDKQIEEFVNEFKSKIAILNDKFKLFELVNGEMISYWYDEKRYDRSKLGTLHSSCMRYTKCQKYFGIYISNTEACKLLILKIIEKDGSELIIPVMIIVKADKLNEIQQSYLHRVVYNLFNKRFIVNKQPKLPIEKPWWKFWN